VRPYCVGIVAHSCLLLSHQPCGGAEAVNDKDAVAASPWTVVSVDWSRMTVQLSREGKDDVTKSSDITVHVSDVVPHTAAALLVHGCEAPGWALALRDLWADVLATATKLLVPTSEQRSEAGAPGDGPLDSSGMLAAVVRTRVLAAVAFLASFQPEVRERFLSHACLALSASIPTHPHPPSPARTYTHSASVPLRTARLPCRAFAVCGAGRCERSTSGCHWRPSSAVWQAAAALCVCGAASGTFASP
jgi:hypothetical protein